MRPSNRAPDQMRAVSLTPGFARHAEGSCLVKFGDTHVLVTASLEEKAPPFLKGTGKGWVTAEYGMLPRSTHDRMRREAASGKQSGRTQEIQRLVGRSLRAICDLAAMGERQITIDCDVLQADGGTRTAAITGGYVALAQCVEFMKKTGLVTAPILKDHVAAMSLRHRPRACRCWTWTMTKIPPPRPTPISSSPARAGWWNCRAPPKARVFSEANCWQLLKLARKGMGELVTLQKEALA